MPNLELGSVGLAAARWHMECPLCKRAEGAISFEEHFSPNSLGHQYASHTQIICKACGPLGKAEYVFDWACPAGVTGVDHGKAAALVFSMWLADNPPDVVTQLAAIGRGSPELQSEGDRDLGTTSCSACGCPNPDAHRSRPAARQRTGRDAETD